MNGQKISNKRVTETDIKHMNRYK